EKEHSVLFNRVCLEQKNIGYSAIYNMTLKLSYLPNKGSFNEQLFKFNSPIKLVIKNKIHVNLDDEFNIREGFNNNFNLYFLEDNFPNQDHKRDFINKTLYDYCYYLGGYYALEADEKSIDILKREISRINLKENN